MRFKKKICLTLVVNQTNRAFNSEYVGQGILFIQSYLYSEIIHVCLKFLRFFSRKKCLDLKSFSDKSRKTYLKQNNKGPHQRRYTCVLFKPCSYHLDRGSSVEIGVECQIFVMVIFFSCGKVLQFGAHSRYYKGALTQRDNFQ